MAAFISRYDNFGRSIAHEIYHGVENGTIKLIATELADGRRLDHYAQKYYGNGLNYWIIAAASGIRWPLGIGTGSANKPVESESSTVIFVPDLNDVIKLKNKE